MAPSEGTEPREVGARGKLLGETACAQAQGRTLSPAPPTWPACPRWASGTHTQLRRLAAGPHVTSVPSRLLRPAGPITAVRGGRGPGGEGSSEAGPPPHAAYTTLVLRSPVLALPLPTRPRAPGLTRPCALTQAVGSLPQAPGCAGRRVTSACPRAPPSARGSRPSLLCPINSKRAAGLLSEAITALIFLNVHFSMDNFKPLSNRPFLVMSVWFASTKTPTDCLNLAASVSAGRIAAINTLACWTELPPFLPPPKLSQTRLPRLAGWPAPRPPSPSAQETHPHPGGDGWLQLSACRIQRKLWGLETSVQGRLCSPGDLGEAL